MKDIRAIDQNGVGDGIGGGGKVGGRGGGGGLLRGRNKRHTGEAPSNQLKVAGVFPETICGYFEANLSLSVTVQRFVKCVPRANCLCSEECISWQG